MKVAELYALIGYRVDQRSLTHVHSSLRGIKSAALGLGAYFGARGLGSTLIGFNMRMEDAKNSIASMLALAQKTGLNEQLATSAQLYENIRKRAATLPGTAEEYVNAMSRLTYPIMTAGLGLKKLEDLTVNAVVAAKGVGITTVAASIRDVQQALEGRFSSTDLFLKSILEPRGFVGEEGRARFKGLSKAERANELEAALSQRAILESAELQAKSMSGQIDKLKEALAQFLGHVGLPIFKALGDAIREANVWLEANKETVQAIADAVGGALREAFDLVRAAIEFLTSDTDEAKAVVIGFVGVLTLLAGRMLMAWIAALGPIALVAGAIAAIAYLFLKLRDKVGDVKAAIATAFAVGGVLLFIKKIGDVAKAMKGLRSAAAAANLANGVANAGSAFFGGGYDHNRDKAQAKGKGGGMGGLVAAGGPIGAAISAAYMIDQFASGGETLFGWADRTMGERNAGITGALDAVRNFSLDGKAPLAPSVTNNVAPILNLNITGVKDANDVEKVVQAEFEKVMRFAADATMGGRR